MALSLGKSLFLYVIFLLLAFLGVAYFVWTAPPLPHAQCAEIVTPMDVISGRLIREPKKSILDLWNCLREYKKNHWWHATAGIWGAYVVFKIFGPLGAGTSLVLSVLIGALYDEWSEPYTKYSLMAHCLSISGELVGGAGGWIMSYAFGREILLYCVPNKMAALKTRTDAFQGSMFRYVLFLRMSPLFPNWFVNYGTALIGVPFMYFLTASFLALQPTTVLSISMGHMLHEMGKTGLDMVKMGKRGCVMALIMTVLSSALIPVSDYQAGFVKCKGRLNDGLNRLRRRKRRPTSPFFIPEDAESSKDISSPI